MESPQMYDNNQNNLPMAANTKPTTNGANAANNNNTITINANLKNDHVNGGLTNGTALLQKQIQQHPQQLLQQQQQIQQVVQHYTQNDLEELTNPEISLDLANFIDDQFRSEQEQFAFFNKIVPAAINAGANVVNGNGLPNSEAAKALQQARFQQRQNPQNPLQYIPGCVTGEDGSNSENASIKEEPVEPIELRRLQQLTANGQFLNSNYQFPNGNSNGTTFTSLTPASVLHHQQHVPRKFPTHAAAHLTSFQKLNKNLVSRKNSLKNVDKGTEEYRRRRERNNIAVRKSREKAKKRAHDVEKKMKDLQKENESLRRCDEEKTNVILLYNQVFMRLSNHSNPEIKQIVSLELNSMNMQCDQGMNMQNSLLHNSYLTKDT